MPLWSFPAVVTGIADLHVALNVDLGCRLYTNALVEVVGLGGKSRATLPTLLPSGTRVLATCPPLTGAPVRAHLTLTDGRDVAAVIKRRPTPATPAAVYGGTLAKTWTYPGMVEKVVDGDTFHAAISVGCVTYRTVVRVSHVNAPELSTDAGRAAMVWATSVLAVGLPITLNVKALDKYGRLLAACLLPDGHDYAGELLATGNAVPYEGGKRTTTSV